jgi:hypothetical protein
LSQSFERSKSADYSARRKAADDAPNRVARDERNVQHIAYVEFSRHLGDDSHKVHSKFEIARISADPSRWHVSKDFARLVC